MKFRKLTHDPSGESTSAVSLMMQVYLPGMVGWISDDNKYLITMVPGEVFRSRESQIYIQFCTRRGKHGNLRIEEKITCAKDGVASFIVNAWMKDSARRAHGGSSSVIYGVESMAGHMCIRGESETWPTTDVDGPPRWRKATLASFQSYQEKMRSKV